MTLVVKENYKIIEINSYDCFDILKKNIQTHLIDVRTQSEWELVGVPDLTSNNKQTIFISWHLNPEMRINDNFGTEILHSKIKKDDIIFLICRSGRRSLEAAQYLNKLGYNNCYNVFDGFEGNKDLNNHRSKLNGWKYNKLPWKQ